MRPSGVVMSAMTAYYPIQYDHPSVPLSPYASFVHVPQAQYPNSSPSSTSASASAASAASAASDMSMLAMQRMPSLTSLPDMDVPHTPLVPVSPSYAVTPTSTSFNAMPSPSLPLGGSNVRPPSWSSVFQSTNMSGGQPLPALPLAAMSAAAATPPVSPSPYMPGVNTQYYHSHNGQFSMEIPFANEDSQKAAAEAKAAAELAEDNANASSPVSNPSSPKSRKRARPASAAANSSKSGSKKKSNNNSNDSSPTSNSYPNHHMSAAELKKQKHREIDAARRKREADAVNRLLKLIEGAKDANGNAAASGNEMRNNAGDDDDDGEGGGKGKDKMDKVGILEVVGNRLEEVEGERDRLKADLTKEREKAAELSEVVMRLSKQAKALASANASNPGGAAANNGASSDSLSILDPLTSLSPSARSYISQLEQSSALYSSSFIHSSLIFLILSVTTGRCVDANSKFCQVAGWKREEVIGKPFVQPKAELMQESKDSSDSSSTPHSDPANPANPQQASSSSSSGGGGVGGAGMLMWGVGMGKNSRYASNRAELLALYTGRKKAVTCCFRVALAKGQLVDVRCRCWLGHAGEGADAAKDAAAAAAGLSGASASAGGGAASPTAAAGVDGVKPDGEMVATHLIVQTTEEDIIVLS